MSEGNHLSLHKKEAEWNFKWGGPSIDLAFLELLELGQFLSQGKDLGEAQGSSKWPQKLALLLASADCLAV